MNKKVLTISIVLVLVIAMIAGFLFWKNQCDEKVKSKPVEENQAQVEITEEVLELKTYQNADYGFAFDYPSDWILTDHYGDSGVGRVDAFRYVSLGTVDNFIVGVGVKNQSEGDWVVTRAIRTGLAAGEFAQTKKINIGEGVAEEKPLIFKDSNNTITQTVWFCAPIVDGEKLSTCNDFAIGKGMVARVEIDHKSRDGKATEEQWRGVEVEVEKMLDSLRFTE